MNDFLKDIIMIEKKKLLGWTLEIQGWGVKYK